MVKLAFLILRLFGLEIAICLCLWARINKIYTTIIVNPQYNSPKFMDFGHLHCLCDFWSYSRSHLWSVSASCAFICTFLSFSVYITIAKQWGSCGYFFLSWFKEKSRLSSTNWPNCGFYAFFGLWFQGCGRGGQVLHPEMSASATYLDFLRLNFWRRSKGFSF